jgi:hypothetical protein
VSNKTRAKQETNEGGMVRTQDIYIPEPTVTEGVVSLLPAKKDQQANADVKTYDTVGNTYQLDIYAGDCDRLAALEFGAACCLRGSDIVRARITAAATQCTIKALGDFPEHTLRSGAAGQRRTE